MSKPKRAAKMDSGPQQSSQAIEKTRTTVSVTIQILWNLRLRKDFYFILYFCSNECFRLFVSEKPSKALLLTKQLLCAKIIDRGRILFGTEDGLFCGELAKDEFIRITDKRVSDIRLCTDVDIIAIISGNRRTVRLFPIAAAISGTYEQEPPKLEETRNCSHLATGMNST